MALTASPACEMTVGATILKMEELLDRLGADLAAPVDTLEEVGGCRLHRATIPVLMFRLVVFCGFRYTANERPMRSAAFLGAQVGGVSVFSFLFRCCHSCTPTSRCMEHRFYNAMEKTPNATNLISCQ